MNTFVDTYRDAFGVEPICRVLKIAPSGYRLHATRQRNPALRCARAQRDEVLIPKIERVWQANLQVYGADKVWRQMKREGTEVARCTVERLMNRLGLRGAVRGKSVRTTVPDSKQPCPLDRVNRQFKADRPNQLWVSDFTYVSTWQGWLYVAFVINVFARRIVGWRVSRSMTTDFVLDALEQALPALGFGLLDPVQQIRREEGSLSVIAMIIWADGTALRWCVEPALGSQVAADFGFVDNFVMDGHEGKPIGYDGFVDGATSFIWDLRG